jgi:hypothetical protein
MEFDVLTQFQIFGSKLNLLKAFFIAVRNLSCFFPLDQMTLSITAVSDKKC